MAFLDAFCNLTLPGQKEGTKTACAVKSYCLDQHCLLNLLLKLFCFSVCLLYSYCFMQQKTHPNLPKVAKHLEQAVERLVITF